MKEFPSPLHRNRFLFCFLSHHSILPATAAQLETCVWRLLFFFTSFCFHFSVFLKCMCLIVIFICDGGSDFFFTFLPLEFWPFSGFSFDFVGQQFDYVFFPLKAKWPTSFAHMTRQDRPENFTEFMRSNLYPQYIYILYAMKAQNEKYGGYVTSILLTIPFQLKSYGRICTERTPNTHVCT